MTPNRDIDADDWLDDMLRDAGREHRAEYIADDGFTQRLMAKLPEPATLPAWRRPALALLWVFGVGAVMMAVPGVFEELFRGAMVVLSGHRLGVPDIAAAVVLFAGATWSALVYAMRSD
ncbi:MAG: DUF5056 domain-containing protein [Pseudomonadota bacterium]|nr:DUF5056 domain-containing protein [Pseudomonadota bacterium]